LITPRSSMLHSYYRLLAGNRRLSSAAVAASAASGLAEALGLASLLPILQNGDATLRSVAPWLGVLAAFLIASTGLRLLVDVLIGRIVTRVELRAREQLLDRLVNARWQDVSKLSHGDTTSALMSEAQQLSNGVYALLNGVAQVLIVTMLMATATVLNPSLLAAAAAFMVVSYLIYRYRLSKVRDNQQSLSIANADVTEDVAAAIGDLRFMRESGSDIAWQERTRIDANLLGDLRLRALVLPSVTKVIVDSIGALFLAFTIGATVWATNGLALGVVFVGIFYRVISRVQAAQISISTASAQLPWLSRWDTRLAALSDRHYAGVTSNTYEATSPPSIELSGVTFSYPGRSSLIIDSSFVIHSGEHVALIGASGSGKSTLVDVILGLVEPDVGEVQIDGEILGPDGWAAFRRSVGLVPQDVAMRKGSLADNITWDRPIDHEALRDAVTRAELAAFVKTLDAGLDTQIDSKTIGLSGGQRQRIGLARAFYRNPKFLILDEATSGLDGPTERAIFETVFRTGRAMTIIAVSHRETIFDYAGRVIAIDDGAIASRRPRHKEGTSCHGLALL
jgi:ABC-type bacteriocin/lantibiotic exporter with double-glycine peptidase domain